MHGCTPIVLDSIISCHLLLPQDRKNTPNGWSPAWAMGRRARLTSKCSKVSESCRFAGSRTRGKGRCPCCCYPLKLKLTSSTLSKATLQLTSQRAPGKLFEAMVQQGVCRSFCPACRRPLKISFAMNEEPLPRWRRRSLLVGRSARRWFQASPGDLWCISSAEETP